MGLPGSRERTYGTTEPVRGTDLNAIQDAIIGAKHASLTLWFFPAGRVVTAGGGALTGNSGWVSESAGSGWACGVPLFQGTRITGAKVRYQGSGAEVFPFSMSMLLNRGDIAQQLYLAGYDAMPGDALWHTVDFNVFDVPNELPYTLQAGESVSFEVTHTDAGQRISAFGVVIDRL